MAIESRIRSWQVMFVVFSISIITAVLPLVAQDDPFGGTDNPFGSTNAFEEPVPAGDDPFDDAATFDRGVTDAKLKAAKERDDAFLIQLEKENRKAIVEGAIQQLRQEFFLMQSISQDGLCIDAGLSWLHAALAQEDSRANDVVDVFAHFAQCDWQPAKPDEAPATMIARKLAAGAAFKKTLPKRADCGFTASIHVEYAKIADWRKEEKFYLRLMSNVFASLAAENRAEVWHKLIKEDAAHSDLYAAAYVGLVAGKTEKQPDTGLISRFVAGAGDNKAERLVRLAKCLWAVNESGLKPDHLINQRLRDRFLFELAQLDENLISTALPELAKTSADEFARMPAFELIATNLMARESPQLFYDFAQRAHLSESEIQSEFLAKSCSVSLADVSPAELFNLLQSRVRLQLWVDDSVAKLPEKVTLKTSGTWWEVLNAAANASACEVAMLDEELIWVGPPIIRPAAEKLLREARGKIPSEALLTHKLNEVSLAEFTGRPAEDCVDFFKDLHGVEIVVGGEFGDEKRLYSCQHSRLPLCLTLERLCRDIKLDWAAGNEVIFIAEPANVAEFRSLLARNRFRRLQLQLRKDAVAKALLQTTVFEFIETPIPDVLDYVQDLHDTKIVLDEELGNDLPITANLKGLNLDWALAMLLSEYKLDYFADEQLIFVGSPARCQAYAALAKTRKERRQKYPMALCDALKKTVSVDLCLELREVVSELSNASGLTIQIDPDDEGLASKEAIANWQKLPTDVCLDFLTFNSNFTWSIVGDKAIVIRAKKDP